MARFLHILAIDRPWEAGEDAENRRIFIANYQAAVSGTAGDNVEEAVASLINTAGGGTLGTDLFIGFREAVGDGPIVNIILGRGGVPSLTQNDDRYEPVAFKIVVRASTYPAARTRAMLIWRYLDGTHNTTVAA